MDNNIYTLSREQIKKEFFTEPYYSIEYIINNIENAINNKIPFSILRVGDAEAAMLGQGTVFDYDFIKRGWPQLFNRDKNFIRLPDLKLRDELKESFENADILSMFAINKHNAMPNGNIYNWHGELMKKALGYYNLIPNEGNYMYTFANVEIMKFQEWWNLFKKYKTALIGMHMDELKDKLVKYNCNIVYSSNLENHNLIDKYINELRNIDFDWILVSASASAKVFINKVKKELGKVGFDFGSATEYFLGMRSWDPDIFYDALKGY